MCYNLRNMKSEVATPIKTREIYPLLPAHIKRQLPQKQCLFDMMSCDLIEKFNAFAFEKSDNKLKIAAVDPENMALRQFTDDYFGGAIVWFQALEEDIALVLGKPKKEFILKPSGTEPRPTPKPVGIIDMVDRILALAIKDKASDIHIEPMRDEVVVRFRIDGGLRKMYSLPKDLHQTIVARFKVLAELMSDEHRRPQEGRIVLKAFPGISLRVSIIPTLHGAKIAMRILDESSKNLSIEDLGLSKANKAIVLRNIEKPYGLIVSSGPTGSGKTTSLYALLGLIGKEDINISTLEDPVEYAVDGVNQVQINPQVGLTFAAGLRSLLRQDPDVMMVGEIRDSETAVMAGDAALTGHLILTTMHTNDAPSVVTRLSEMKLENFVVSSTVNLVIAQRLVRKLCSRCSVRRVPGAALLKKINARKDLRDALSGMHAQIGNVKKNEFPVAVGCEACLYTGYAGRIGIFEILEFSKKIRALVLRGASSEQIRAEAMKNGFRDIISDGLDKVLAGATTIDEILRVTRNV